MIKREIEIDGSPVIFRASATVPRLYRAKFQRDIFKDLMSLEKTLKETKAAGDNGSSDMGIDSLEIFENVAYIMAKHADPNQPDTPEEWLDQFGTFSIYEVFPALLDLWYANVQTESEHKKKQIQAAGK